MLDFTGKHWHLLSKEEVLKALETSLKGLSQKQADERLKEFGFNELKEQKKKSLFLVFLEQFKNFLIWILLVAAVVSVLVGEVLDAVVILIIVFLNSLLGFWQEFKAEEAMKALKKMTALKAKVLRNTEEVIIDAKLLVPGDIILVEQGDRIPADARVLESINLQTDESALTGESTPVEKLEKVLEGHDVIAERKNMLFANTMVSYGRGKAVVAATGMRSEFGKIAKGLQEIEEDKSPLAVKIEEFGKTLGYLIIIICIAVFALLLLTQGFSFEILLVAIALAVAAIPEGLPAVVTIGLALGMQEMARQNAIVRKIAAVETLGCTTIICADKTGTLTRNEMTVTRIMAAGRQFEVKGSGFVTEGEILFNGKQASLEREKTLGLLFKTSVLCNNAELGISGNHIGDPTELALLVAGKKAGIDRQSLEALKFATELSFDSERKRMSVVFSESGKQFAYCKGSVESVLEASDSVMLDSKMVKFSENEKRKILEKNAEMANNGLRVLAFAFKEISGRDFTERNVESKMVFLGIAGMIDAARSESKSAVETCRKAGINVIMITGDHKLTALAVAKELGIASSESEAITGQELDRLSEKQLKEKIGFLKVFARVTPEHKLMIVSALKAKGEVVAVTGDGVNDALALKKADIGVAMGITGTDVAKEASKMIITDDDFATIVKAIQQGRNIYQNIRSFVKYLLSANSGEIAVIVSAVALRMPLILLPLQILWINLVTDGLPALALSKEKADESIMLEKPRAKKAKITDGISSFIIITAVLTAIAVLISFNIGMSAGIEKARTMAFATIAFFELFLVFTCRSERKNFFELNPFSNKSLLLAVGISALLMLAVIYTPFLQAIFKTTELNLKEFSIAIILAATALLTPSLHRALSKKTRGSVF